MLKYNYTINGRFLTQNITGVQRCAHEMVRDLDILADKDDIEILVPKSTKLPHEYHNICVVRFGHLSGVLWEQISYPIYLILHRRKGLNFCSSPIIRPDYAYIHDVLFQKNPAWCTRKYYIYTSLLFNHIIHHAKKIFTVSYFSKQEIQDYYGRQNKELHVIGNAWQHMERINEDPLFFLRHPEILKGEYIFSLSSLAPYKNYRWIHENARLHPNQQYVIAGSINPTLFGTSNDKLKQLSNIIYIGYVTDEEAKTLIVHAKAFLFPSFYEGFGIPPLEALSCGIPIIISDIPCFREVFGNAAHYIDPLIPNVDLNELLGQKIDAANSVLEKYSWTLSAKKLYTELE